MSRELIIRNRATQDLRQQANYILGNGNVAAAEQFLELAEATFRQILLVLCGGNKRTISSSSPPVPQSPSLPVSPSQS